MSHRYTAQEMDQWQHILHREPDASRPASAPASTAKGAGGRTSKRPQSAATYPETENSEEWASECLFECYND